MRFLSPEFLFALFVVAVPVIVHLFNFKRFTRVAFSNVAFLREIQQQSSAPRNLKRRLLLAARSLALIFLVLAFARPYIPSSGSEAIAANGQIISIYVDNSFSMEVLNKEGSLLDEARRRAKEIASVYGLNDKFQLLTNEFDGRQQRLLNYEDFIAALDEVKPCRLRRQAQQVIDQQQDLLSQYQGPNKVIYLVSDFQKNNFSSAAIHLPKGVDCRLVKINASPQPNISIDSVWFVSPVHRVGTEEKLVVLLKNNSRTKSEKVPLKVFIDQQPKALGSVEVAPGAAVHDTLSVGGLAPGWKKGVVEITDYPVTFDDHFFFTFYVRQTLPVLAINYAPSNRYLTAVYATDSFFSLKEVDGGKLDYATLGNFPLTILNGTAGISEGFAAQMKRYVEEGGHLFVFPSAKPEDLQGLRLLTLALGTDVPSEISSAAAKVTSVNFQHPLFSGVFSRRTTGNADLPMASRYMVYNRISRTGRTPIMDLPGSRTFLAQYAIGAGAIYLSAVGLDEESGNLVRHSLFVPLMFQSAFISLHDRPLAYTIGQDTYLDFNRMVLRQDQTLKLKNEKIEIIPDLRQSEHRTRLFVADQVREEGHYRLLKADSLMAWVAFNDNRQESDLSCFSVKDLSAVFPSDKVRFFEPEQDPLKNVIKATNNGVQLWKLCLILALIFLAAEILLLRFYDRRNATPGA